MERTMKPANRLSGEVVLPGDKSISHRAVMIGAIARGTTRIRNLLDCDDCNFTIRAFREMGVAIETRRAVTVVRGRGLRGLVRPERPLFAGSSGTTMRILAGILSGQTFEARLTGDEGLLKRPMRRVVEPLREMGVDVRAQDNEHPPLFIRGTRPIPISYSLDVPSAQVKSAIIFAALNATGTTVVKEKIPSRDHTERMLKYFGADIVTKGRFITVRGGRELSGRDVTVPGDISSAAFFLAGAALLPGSRLTVKSASLNPTRTGIINVLKRMGVRLVIAHRRDLCEPSGDITVESSKTRGIVITRSMTPSLIDEIPVIAVVAALSSGRTVIGGIGELRVKETDRVESIVSNLKRMGADIAVSGDSLVIRGVRELAGASIRSFSDHRTAMAMTIAACAAKGPSVLDDTECVSKSFPQFFEVLEGLIPRDM